MQTGFGETLAIDTGETIIGMLCIDDSKYTQYREGSYLEAIERIRKAKEVITWAGDFRDMLDLGKFAGLLGALPIEGFHCDMQLVCTPGFRGKGEDEQRLNGFRLPELPADFEWSDDDYVVDNWRDCQRPFQLWDLWRKGKIVRSAGPFEKRHTLWCFAPTGEVEELRRQQG